MGILLSNKFSLNYKQKNGSKQFHKLIQAKFQPSELSKTQPASLTFKRQLCRLKSPSNQ